MKGLKMEYDYANVKWIYVTPRIFNQLNKVFYFQTIIKFRMWSMDYQNINARKYSFFFSNDVQNLQLCFTIM